MIEVVRLSLAATVKARIDSQLMRRSQLIRLCRACHVITHTKEKNASGLDMTFRRCIEFII